MDLSFCQVGDDSLQGFTSYTRLETLSLWQCPITDVGAQRLACLQTLTDLNLTNCVSITNSGLKYIGKLAQLKRLNLSGLIHISEPGLDLLLTLTVRKFLYAD